MASDRTVRHDRPQRSLKEAARAPATASEATAKSSAPLDLTCSVVSATLSVRMFTLEVRLDIANRGSSAVRDLIAFARLTSARSDTHEAPLDTGTAPDIAFERIGPRQARSATMTLQLPLSEVRAIRQRGQGAGQAGQPVFVPLLTVMVERAGAHPQTYRFAIGNPSATNQARLHPLPLDIVPGGLRGVRANLIRDVAAEARVREAVEPVASP